MAPEGYNVTNFIMMVLSQQKRGKVCSNILCYYDRIYDIHSRKDSTESNKHNVRDILSLTQKTSLWSDKQVVAVITFTEYCMLTTHSFSVLTFLMNMIIRQ